MLRSVPLLAFALTALPALAQTAPPATSAATALLPPAGLYYRYWPLQLVQWVGPELPWSMIVLFADDRPTAPSYDVELVDRASGRQTHYANKPELVAEDKAKGYDAFLTRMQFDQPAAPGIQAQYLLRFNNEKEQPLLWQFVQGTDISEQGSGVTPIDAPFPILLYREQGALAGQGTALKIGDITSTAEVWKEYAQPPYFVPYHGAITVGAHILSIAPIQSSWTDPQPTSLSAGATWQLTSARGSVFAVRAETVNGPAASVSLTDSAHGTATTVEAQQTATGWAITRVRFGPTGAKPDHTLSVTFAPPLAPGVESRFEIIAGKKTKVASGSVQTSADTAGSGAITEKWILAAPDWAKGKTATASAGVQH